MQMKMIIVFTTFLLLVGCSSTPISLSGEPPVRYAQYVKATTYDSTLRPPTKKLTILRGVSDQKFHIIATLTINGAPEKEGDLINALAWKGRQIGADSITGVCR
jgi:hypothetical protein